MATCLDLMNKVLIGLRQDALASGTTETTTKYGKLILQYVNEAKEEVEEAWEWESLRTTVTVTLAAGTAEYTLTSGGDADVDTNERSKLLYEKGSFNDLGTTRGFGKQPLLWDTTDTGERRLTEIEWEAIETLHATDNNEQQDPTYFALKNDGTSLKMKVWPTPADARTIVGRFYIPEAEVASNALGTTVTAPFRPIYTLALWKANAERGEEISAPGMYDEQAYMKALSVAIAREQNYVDITSFPV